MPMDRQQQQSREKRNMYWCYYHSYCFNFSPRTIHNSSHPACNTDSNRITQLMVYSRNNIDRNAIIIIMNIHTNRGNKNKITNTTTRTTIGIKGQGTCLYSLRELKSIDIYIYLSRCSCTIQIKYYY